MIPRKKLPVSVAAVAVAVVSVAAPAPLSAQQRDAIRDRHIAGKKLTLCIATMVGAKRSSLKAVALRGALAPIRVLAGPNGPLVRSRVDPRFQIYRIRSTTGGSKCA